MWRKPVGLGAMRTRTDIGRSRLSACCSAPTAQAGSRAPSTGRSRSAPTRCSSSRRARGRGASPSTPRRISRASVSGARRRRSAPCSCTRSTSATSRRRTSRLRQEPRDDARDGRRRKRDRGGRRRLPRRLAPRRRLRRRARALCAGAREVLEHCSDTTWLLLENSAGAGGTIGRSIDELAAIVDALDGHPRLGICLDSCHLYVSGVDVGDPKHGRRRSLADVDDADRARPAARAARQRRGGAARLEPRPARERARRRARRAAWARSSPTRALQSLPAVMETPGPDGHGPDAAEMQKLRDLHARWTRR